MDLSGCQEPISNLVWLSDGVCTASIWDEACNIYTSSCSVPEDDCTHGPAGSTATCNPWDECIYTYSTCAGDTGGSSGTGSSGTDSGSSTSGSSTSGSSTSGSSTSGSITTGSSGDAGYHDVPLQRQVTGVQPMTGIVLWEDDWNSDPIKTGPGNIQLEYAYVAPSSIVVGPSTYDWSGFEDFLDRIAGRGHQAVVRFYYTYRGRETVVPQYIKDLPDYQEQQGTSDGKLTWFPDWTSSALEDFHLEFYSTFASLYDGDPRIAFLQTGFGLWAEYHIYDGPNTIGVHFPSKAFQTTFLEHLDAVLPTLHWSVSIDAGDSYYSPIPGDATMLGLGFGNFDDSFMHETHDQYNESMWNEMEHTLRYERAPHGGELSYYSDYDQQHALDVGGMYGRTYEQLSAQFHISYMIGNDQPSYQTDARIRDAGMANGYRFRILSFQSKDSSSRVEVTNEGIAPLYYDAFVTVDGVRATDSLRGLLPGQTQLYTVAAGGDAPELTIECDRLVSGQVIEFDADLL